MTFVLRVYRITALVLWSAVAALLSVPCQLRGGWKGIRDISRFTHLWTKGVARIVNLRVKVAGEMPALSGGLVVSNHLGYVDIITHGSVLPVRYTPKKEIAAWPLLGWYLGLSRPIWIDRQSKHSSKKALRDFAKTMKKGMYLIVYPEGTSTDGRNGILPFKSTPFEAAITGGAPIVPVITRYREAPGSQTVCWYGDMTLLPHVWQVLGMPAIEAEMHFMKPVMPDGKPRKELASHVHGLMSREYRKLQASACFVLIAVAMAFAPMAARAEGEVESLKDYKYWSNGKVRGMDIYDANGRLRAKTFVRPDGSTEKLEKYDELGNKVEMAYYDERGRLKAGLDGWAATRWYYDGSRLVAEMTFDEFGKPLERRQYTESGRLAARFYRDRDDLNPYEQASMAVVLGEQNIPNVPFKLRDE